jgi:hypothetical protein
MTTEDFTYKLPVDNYGGELPNKDFHQVSEQPHTCAIKATRIPGMFLKGPIAMDWLNEAAKQPGKALHVAVAICLWRGIMRRNTFRLSVSKLKEMGVQRNSAYRALTALETAGLISLERHQGRNPIVTTIGLI